jgi:putative ABC transport system substrate-binding protein
MDRRTLLARLAAFGAVASAQVEAAAPPRRRRLAVLLFDRRESWTWFEPELRDELAALGWVEGKNLGLQWNYADGDLARLRSLAAQIVASAPDVILVRGTPATHVLQEATRTIPIVTGVGDPIGSGFAKTYAEPAGNVTGISWAIAETTQKSSFFACSCPGCRISSPSGRPTACHSDKNGRGPWKRQRAPEA